MDVETGLNRIAKAISILGWGWAVIWLGIAIVVGVLSLFGDKSFDTWFVVVLSIVTATVGLGIAAGVAWIIRGFAQRPGAKQ